ncbi:MAG: hypothetical protein ABI699_08935 [Caldimonas sp.]
MPWSIDRDLVIAGKLRLAVQRIGIDHWRADARLRSWGLAPLHREGDAILVSCATNEALWLGAWLEETGSPASVHLRDPIGGGSARIVVPPDDQLTALENASQGRQPLALAEAGAAGTGSGRTLALALEVEDCSARVDLVLLPPGEWSTRARRTPAQGRNAPPPLPPRLG